MKRNSATTVFPQEHSGGMLKVITGQIISSYVSVFLIQGTPAFYGRHPMKTVPRICQMFTDLKYHATSLQFHGGKLSAAVSRSNYRS